MAEIVDFKVFLKNGFDENFDEIRRFSMESTQASDFGALVVKLHNIFPDLRGTRFTVSWLDDENDEIVISGSEELQIFLRETKNKNPKEIRKLYVTLQTENKKESFQSQRLNLGSSNPQSKVHHSGVVCDGCDTDIYGFRYKCLQCPDYDLCHDCEIKCLHPEHCMLRLSVPKQWKSHYGRSLTRHLNRFMKRATTITDEDAEECPFRSSKIRNSYNSTSTHPRSTRCDAQPSWFDVLSTYLNDWATEAPASAPPSTPSAVPKAEKEKPTTAQPTPSQDSKPTTSRPSSKRSSQDNMDVLFKNLGEHFAQFLDPFGIDVKVSTNGAASSQKSAPQDKATSPNSNNGKQTTTTATATEAPKEPAVKIGFKSTVINGSQTTPSAPTVTQPQKSSSEESDEWTFVSNDLTSSTSTSTPSPTTPGNTPETPKSQSEAASKVEIKEDKPATRPTDNLYPTLDTNNASNVYHSNPKIQKAVETMMQMGFSNEGGWLTQLLVRKDGDISKVLDLLQPARD